MTLQTDDKHFRLTAGLKLYLQKRTVLLKQHSANCLIQVTNDQQLKL